MFIPSITFLFRRLSPALCLLIGGTLAGAAENVVPAGNTGPVCRAVVSTEQVQNVRVQNTSGESLGRIEDLVFDLRSGQVRYVAVAFSSLLDKEKLHAIPLQKFRCPGGPLADHLIFPESPATLRDAPGFSRHAWPNFADRKWAEPVDIYYGVVIKQGDLQTDFGTDVQHVDEVPSLVRASELLEREVLDETGRRYGKIADLAVSLATGDAHSLLIDRSGAGDESAQVTIPWSSVSVGLDGEKPVIHVDRTAADDAGNGPEENWLERLSSRAAKPKSETTQAPESPQRPAP